MSKIVRLLDREPGQKAQLEVAGFIIDSDIPPPLKLGAMKAALREVIGALEIGQSFLAPQDYDRAEIYRVGKEFKDRLFSAKKMTNGTRVWRVE